MASDIHHLQVHSRYLLQHLAMSESGQWWSLGEWFCECLWDVLLKLLVLFIYIIALLLQWEFQVFHDWWYWASLLCGCRSHSWGVGHPISCACTTNQLQEIQGTKWCRYKYRVHELQKWPIAPGKGSVSTLYCSKWHFPWKHPLTTNIPGFVDHKGTTPLPHHNAWMQFPPPDDPTTYGCIEQGSEGILQMVGEFWPLQKASLHPCCLDFQLQCPCLQPGRVEGVASHAHVGDMGPLYFL